jgi:hypothetical protein
MNQMTTSRTFRASQAPSTAPDPRRWQRRQALYSRRAARSDTFCSARSGAARDARLDTLADQRHAALKLLLATPAPTLADATTKLDLYVAELAGFDPGEEMLRHILADFRRLG